MHSQKRLWAKSHGFLPKNSEILKSYRSLLRARKIKKNPILENLLWIHKVRTQSGVAPVAVLTKPYPCPGKCIYCPTQAGIPKSYLRHEPAVDRASKLNFNPYNQVKVRLKQLYDTGHSIDKIHLIVIGGTFSFLPKKYKIWFIKECFRACNDFGRTRSSPGLELSQHQKINEKTKVRITGITLETRPDWITIDEIKLMRKLGCTRVEIGVQSVDNHVLRRILRGHSTKEIVRATKLLKDAGFKVCYHLMPNLPCSNPKKDLEMFKKVFSEPRFQPDMIKIYPCAVTKEAKLYSWYQKGNFKPYKDKQLIKLLLKIKKIVPEYVRINRLFRDIPGFYIVAGCKLTNIRQILSKMDAGCKCIRCREIKQEKFDPKNLKLKIKKYKASGGEEYFLQFVDQKNRLYALLRLRIPSQVFSKKKHFIPVLNNSSIIRELHTFGFALPISKKETDKTQHRGLGKKLLEEAEKITKHAGLNKIAIISGVGVREYYQNQGFHLKKTYEVKLL